MRVLVSGNKNYSSWSLRSWVLMRTLGIAFEERLVPFGTAAWAAGEITPSGKVPCLLDDGVVVWDSLAIAEYLAERHDRVWPADPVARAWARCAAAEMHAGFAALRETCTMNCGLRVRVDPWPADVLRDLARLEALWGEGLACFGGPFLAGATFGAVDAFFAPVAFRVQSYAPALAAGSRAYVDRLLALPAMAEWYRAGLAEPWRDAPHEAEALAAGTVIADFRTG